MKRRQSEQVLLVLGSRNKRVTQLVNISQHENVEIMYTDRTTPYTNRHMICLKIYPGGGGRYRKIVAVKDLRYFTFPHKLDKVCWFHETVKVKIRNHWSYLLAPPLKSGPACFVDHVVL